MKFCKRCLYHENHPLYLTFDDNGICSGCRVHEEKKKIDWNQKKLELEKLISPYRRSESEFNYDCVIPVTGGKDSFYTVHLVKNVLKLNPVLVSFNRHFNTDLGIRNLLKLKDAFDCDLMQMVIKPQTFKKLVKFGLEKYGNIYWPIHIGSKTFPVQIATKLNIPLVIWGHHQGLDQVGMYSHDHKVEMSEKYHFEHDWCAHHINEVIGYENLSKNDIELLKYPKPKDIEKSEVRGIFLGNFFCWDQTTQNDQMIKQFDFETEKQTRTFNTYDDQDCFLFNDVHDYLKALKHGYSKVSDHANREIRWGRLNKEQAINLVEKYIYKEPSHLSLLSEWLETPKTELEEIIESHRNKNLWTQTDKGWRLNFLPDSEEDSSFKYNESAPIDFKCNNHNPNEKGFLKFSRGWVDDRDYYSIEDY